MKKKVLALGLAAIVAATSLVGCGKGQETSKETGTQEAGTQTAGTQTAGTQTAGTQESIYAADAKLKIWGSQEDQEMYRGLIEQFKQEVPEAAGWDIELAVVMGADAKNELLKDASTAADVFDFASDQVMELKAANALYRITKNKDQIVAANSEESIAAASVDGELYGYPLAATTFLMYYDKNLYTEEEVKSLNTMLEKELPEGVTNFSMDIDNGWFNSSFFQGAGCRLFGENGTDPTFCDFNNEKGVMVGNFMVDMIASKKCANQDGPVLLKAFESRKLGATFQGPWDADNIKSMLGEDYGVTVLPQVTLEDGSTIQLASMMNFNLTGVNAQTKYPAEAMLLAEYMTNNEKALEYRFESRPAAATNKAMAAKIMADTTNEAMQALTKQAELSILQTSIPQVGNFWTPSEAFGAGLVDGSVTKENMKEKLDLLVTSTLAQIK